MKHGSGYAVESTQAGEFKVRFQGNGSTRLEQVYDFALLRTAETSQQQGFHWFAVTDVINNSSVQPYTRTTMEYSSAFPDWSPGLSYAPFEGAPVGFQRQETALYSRPGVTLVVRCFKEKPAKPFTYDAVAVAAQMRKKHGLAPANGG